MINKKALGAAIRNQRKAKKLKQNDVSAETNLSRNYISDIESGRYAPSIDTLSRIARCLDMDLNILKMSEIQVVDMQLDH